MAEDESLFSIRVVCYNGYRGEESPRCFFLNQRQVDVVEILEKLSGIKGKEFASGEELDKWYADNEISEALKKSINKHSPTSIERCKDVMLCLDAKDGKELWKNR